MFKGTLFAGALALLATSFVSQSTSMAGHHGTNFKSTPSPHKTTVRIKAGAIRHAEHYKFHGPFAYPIVIKEGLSEKVYVRRMQLNPVARVIRVTPEQVDIGEAKAERRRIRRLNERHERVYGFYSDREAYDVRFPSVVYLDGR